MNKSKVLPFNIEDLVFLQKEEEQKEYIQELQKQNKQRERQIKGLPAEDEDEEKQQFTYIDIPIKKQRKLNIEQIKEERYNQLMHNFKTQSKKQKTIRNANSLYYDFVYSHPENFYKKHVPEEWIIIKELGVIKKKAEPQKPPRDEFISVLQQMQSKIQKYKQTAIRKQSKAFDPNQITSSITVDWEKIAQEKIRRKSCICSKCGVMTNYQINYKNVPGVIKGRPSQAHIFTLLSSNLKYRKPVQNNVYKQMLIKKLEKYHQNQQSPNTSNAFGKTNNAITSNSGTSPGKINRLAVRNSTQVALNFHIQQQKVAREQIQNQTSSSSSSSSSFLSQKDEQSKQNHAKQGPIIKASIVDYITQQIQSSQKKVQSPNPSNKSQTATYFFQKSNRTIEQYCEKKSFEQNKKNNISNMKAAIFNLKNKKRLSVDTPQMDKEFEIDEIVIRKSPKRQTQFIKCLLKSKSNDNNDNEDSDFNESYQYSQNSINIGQIDQKVNIFGIRGKQYSQEIIQANKSQTDVKLATYFHKGRQLSNCSFQQNAEKSQSIQQKKELDKRSEIKKIKQSQNYIKNFFVENDKLQQFQMFKNHPKLSFLNKTQQKTIQPYTQSVNDSQLKQQIKKLVKKQVKNEISRFNTAVNTSSQNGEVNKGFFSKQNQVINQFYQSQFNCSEALSLNSPLSSAGKMQQKPSNNLNYNFFSLFQQQKDKKLKKQISPDNKNYYIPYFQTEHFKRVSTAPNCQQRQKISATKHSQTKVTCTPQNNTLSQFRSLQVSQQGNRLRQNQQKDSVVQERNPQIETNIRIQSKESQCRTKNQYLKASNSPKQLEKLLTNYSINSDSYAYSKLKYKQANQNKLTRQTFNKQNKNLNQNSLIDGGFLSP